MNQREAPRIQFVSAWNSSFTSCWLHKVRALWVVECPPVPGKLNAMQSLTASKHAQRQQTTPHLASEHISQPSSAPGEPRSPWEEPIAARRAPVLAFNHLTPSFAPAHGVQKGCLCLFLALEPSCTSQREQRPTRCDDHQAGWATWAMWREGGSKVPRTGALSALFMGLSLRRGC